MTGHLLPPSRSRCSLKSVHALARPQYRRRDSRCLDISFYHALFICLESGGYPESSVIIIPVSCRRGWRRYTPATSRWNWMQIAHYNQETWPKINGRGGGRTQRVPCYFGKWGTGVSFPNERFLSCLAYLALGNTVMV